MSGASTPAGPRSNPLYDGPNAGGRTPNWAKKGTASLSNGASGRAAATPLEAPTRDHFGSQFTIPPYERPAYSVETPNTSDGNPACTYHAPPYYVQTPATSDHGLHSPFSSAPSSPPRYWPNGSQCTSDSDTQSHRSMRINPFSKQRVGQALIGKINEDEDEFPDAERDQQRQEKFWASFVWIFVFLLVGLLGMTVLIMWGVYRPSAPEYYYQGMSVRRLELLSRSFDANGVSTPAVYGNISVQLSSHNPNSMFVIHHLSSEVVFGYRSLTRILYGKVEPYTQGPDARSNMTAQGVAFNSPLYGAGPQFEQDWGQQYVALQFLATLRSQVEVVWKLVKSDFTRQVLCTVGVNTTTLQIVNTTCASATNLLAFDH